MSSYVYTKTPVNLDRLFQEIELSSIIVAIDKTNTFVFGDELTVCFKASLSADDKATLDDIVLNHSGQPWSASSSTPISMEPFASKTLFSGKKLFRRLYGATETLLAADETNIDFIVPLNSCKITKAEILWLPEGCLGNFKVYDTPAGTISGYPNVLLNQFGFNVCLSKDRHDDESSYDADLIKDMKLQIAINNPSDVTKTIGVNFVLHEVV